MDIEQHPAIQTLFAALRDDERTLLEQSILAEGCRESLIVARNPARPDGPRLIVDGNHRYEICTAHNLPYQCVELEFKDWDALREWVIRNQIGRRNLADAAYDYWIGCYYQQAVAEERAQRAAPRADLEVKEQDLPTPSQAAAERVGKELGISPRTVQNKAQWKAALDIVGEKCEAVKQQIQNGELAVTQNEALALSKSNVETVADAELFLQDMRNIDQVSAADHAEFWPVMTALQQITVFIGQDGSVAAADRWRRLFPAQLKFYADTLDQHLDPAIQFLRHVRDGCA